MGIGHVAVALGASRAARRVNVGWLVFGAVLADFLLGIFAVLGMEHATVPPDYAHKRYLLFTFPYSHGLLALLLWATVFGFLVSRAFGLESRRVWLIAGLVVLSHYVLDGLVHIAGLPLAGENSPKIGLGLWKNMPLELALETLMTFAAIAIYWRLSAGSSLSRYGMTVFMLFFLTMMWTQFASTVPPEPQVLTGSWLLAPLILSSIAYGLDWQRVRRCVPVGSETQTRNLHPTPEI